MLVEFRLIWAMFSQNYCKKICIQIEMQIGVFYRYIASIKQFQQQISKVMQKVNQYQNQNQSNRSNSKAHIKQAICLNPNCKAKQRRFDTAFTNIKPAQMHPEHIQCEGWVQSLQFLTTKNKKIAFCLPEQTDRLDFLLEPINSAYLMQSVSQNDWKANISNCYIGIRNTIESELIKSHQICIKKITPIIQNNANLVNNIMQLAQMSSKNWTLASDQFYQQKIKASLRQVNHLGLLRLRNCDNLLRQIQRVKDHIIKFERFIWQKQKQHQFTERTQIWRVKEELKRVSQQKDIQAINQQIQMFIASLKLKPIKSQTINNNICIKCPRCNITVQSTLVSTKTFKKAQCFSKFLKHLCFDHSEDLIQNYYKFNKKNIYKLSFEEFLREIQTTDAKKFLIIDRQNLRQKTVNLISSNSAYWLQIVSKNNQNLPRGKYLAAQSTGKDAADILIILAMYQISKLKNVELFLLTKDHFGKTMQPIFQQLGVKVQISESLNIDFKSNSSKVIQISD